MRTSSHFFLLLILAVLTSIGAMAQEPLAATELFVGNDEAQTGTQGNPVVDINHKPYFTAVYHHSDGSADAVAARVQIASDAAFTTIVANTGWDTLTPTANGNRTSEVHYSGGSLECNVTYHWRIKIEDSTGARGPWSSEAASFTVIACPEEAHTLFVGSAEAQSGQQGDPIVDVSLKAFFSAVVTHDNPSTQMVEGKVQFATDPAFLNKIGSTGWEAIAPVVAGNRCSDIQNTGNNLPGSTRIWWRVRFKDSAGVIGPWSSVAASFITVPAPTEPTSLFVDSDDAQAGSQGNPATGVDATPVFSAIFNHQDSGSTATKFRVQLATDALFANEVHTQTLTLTALPTGSRTPNLSYGGPALSAGQTYYWRARMRDQNQFWSPWSTEGASFTVAVGTVPQATLNVTGLSQGTEVAVTLTKVGGAAFPANANLTFTSSEIDVILATVTGSDTIQATLRTGNMAAHGAQDFQVLDGATVIAQGETLVFHPVQQRPERISGSSQEGLNSAMMVGAGVCALQGEFKYGAMDVSIRGRKLPLDFQRTYRSHLSYNGATGQSWASVIDTSMHFDAANQRVEWLTVDGRISSLELAPGGQSGVGPFVENGRYLEWLRFDAGTSGIEEDDYFVGTGPHGNQTTYAFGGRDVLGEAVFRLASYEDRLGNQVAYERDEFGQLIEIHGDLYEASAPSRYRLILQYGADGRLSRILDYADYSADETHLGSSFLGARTWDFIYSTNGDLVEVRGPATSAHGSDAAGATGRTRELYAYLAETTQGHHLMSELYLPMQANLELSAATGVPWLRNEFDGNNRVVEQHIGALTKTDETHRHVIKYNGSTVDHIDPLGRRLTAVLNSQGRPVQVSQHTGTFGIDEFGAIQSTGAKLRSTDPDTYTSSYAYNQHGELIHLVLPRSNERRWLFDDQNASHRSQGNLLRAVMLPGSVDTSVLPAAQRNGLLVTFAYETTFNLPTEEVPPHAFDLVADFDITQPLSGELARDDAQAYRTVFQYDGLGQLTQVSGPTIAAAQSPESPNVGQQLIRQYTYNSFGQVLTSRDMSSYPSGYIGIDVDYEYGLVGFNRGLLTARITDPTTLNERIEFAYDSVGNVRTMKAPHGAVQTSIRDQLSRVVKSISPTIASLNGIQYTVDYTFDQNGNLTQSVIHDPVLDAQGLPGATIRDIVNQWAYGVFGNVTSTTGSVTDQTTRSVSNFYDAAYQLIEQRSPGGTKVVHTYDELGRSFRSFYGMAIGAATSTAIASTTVDYDLNSNVQRTTDPRGFQRTSAFDAYDRLLATDDARSPVTTRLTVRYAHGAAPAGVVISGDDGTGTRQTLSHRKEWLDNQGRTFRTANLALASDLTTPLGYSPTETGTNDTPSWSVTTYLMLPDGRLTSMVGDILDGSSAATSTQAWTMEYDGAGRTSRIVDVAGNVREFTYVNARLAEEFEHSIDSGTQAVQTSRNAYVYDELSRVVSRQACTQDPVLFHHDARNNVAWTSDPRSGITRFDYDLANRMVKQTRSASNLWALTTAPFVSTNRSEDIESVFEFDLDDNLTRAIDNAGNQTTFAYDLAGRLLQTHSANGGKVTVGNAHSLTPSPNTTAYFESTGGYDASGNILQLLDEGGNQIARTFSSESEVLTMQITKGQNSLIAGTSAVSWQYDGLGRVLQMITTQFGGETHTRTQAWNSLSLLESYADQINSGSARQIHRLHDESGRNYATQSPDATVGWIHDGLGRVKSYTVTRSGHATIEGAWTYFGRGGQRSARAIAGDEDIIAQRDQRGRIRAVFNEPRTGGGAGTPRDVFRYLHDEQTGRLEGMLNEGRPVTTGDSRIGQASVPGIGTGRVFGTRTFFDGFGRATGFASEVTYAQSATNASAWDLHSDTQASASQFDRVDFPTETGVFLGEQFMNDPGVGYLETPHTSNYGSTSSPLPQGNGSRFVPNASGDIELEKTSDDQLKIANDGSNTFVYDYQGRMVRTDRVSDDAVIIERAFDGFGLPYKLNINEYLVVDHDFASPNLAGVVMSTPDIRFDGGGLRFTNTETTEIVAFNFPADVRRNAPNDIDGGLTSYHDFVIDWDTSSSFLCNFRFEDYNFPHAQFRLEVGGTTLKLFIRPPFQQQETLLSQASVTGVSNGPVALGIQVTSNLTFAPTLFEVFAGGNSQLSYSSSSPGGPWAPTIVLFEAGENTTRLYRYKGYLDFDFSQADLGVIEYTPQQRVLQMLCGTGLSPGLITPTPSQDDTVGFQGIFDYVLQFLGVGGDSDVAQSVASSDAMQQSGAMGCGVTPEDLADLVARYEMLKAEAQAIEACIKHGQALGEAIDEILKEFEDDSFGSPAPTDLGAYLEATNQFINGSPGIQMDRVVLVRAGNPLVVPFVVNLPLPQRTQFQVTGPSGLQSAITGTVPGQFTGELTWTPPLSAAGQSFDVHLSALVPAISAVSSRPFAEAVVRIEVLPATVFEPAMAIGDSSNNINQSPFGYAHSQDEFHVTYAGEIYALWQENQELLLDFSAFSDVDNNYTWDATGLSGTWGIAPNGDTAQVHWQFPIPGIYELEVTASNSFGQALVTVHLRVMPESRAWNIRREHTSLYTCVWEGITNTGPVWGANYGPAGYYNQLLPPGAWDDTLGFLGAYISNGDFIYGAGDTQYNINNQRYISVGPSGPIERLPNGLLSRAAIGQQIQEWIQQARDYLEFLNDQIGMYRAVIANVQAEIQRQARIAQFQAKWQADNAWWLDHMDEMKIAAFAGTAMVRTFMLPFEGAAMLGYAAGVYVGWDAATKLSWLGFDTEVNQLWAEDQLSSMWEGLKDMGHSLGTTEGWTDWLNEMTLLYDSDNPSDWVAAGWSFGDQVGGSALILYGGAKGGKGAYRWARGRGGPKTGTGKHSGSGEAVFDVGGDRPLISAKGTKWYQFELRRLIKEMEAGDVEVSLNGGLRPVFQQMGKISNATGKEVLLYTKDGKSYLRLGRARRVPLEPGAKNWAHTHPSGDLSPSPGDYALFGRHGKYSNQLHWIVEPGGGCRLVGG